MSQERSALQCYIIPNRCYNIASSSLSLNLPSHNTDQCFGCLNMDFSRSHRFTKLLSRLSTGVARGYPEPPRVCRAAGTRRDRFRLFLSTRRLVEESAFPCPCCRPGAAGTVALPLTLLMKLDS